MNTLGSGSAKDAASLIFLSLIGLSLFLGTKANEMTAKNLIETGWTIEENQESNVGLAKEKWMIR